MCVDLRSTTADHRRSDDCVQSGFGLIDCWMTIILQILETHAVSVYCEQI